ncbi:N-formylglutamate amidohydrolase [Rufibacter sp. LB8]|uniref:N-formylglutamate amidohydrolase n=1 Tax=Rufibacter sp. LB8 TaxID=2777781 RepID=UPI00178C25AB|nr:N-formylglutamate amidohydrolase [Rufibacter sp. LB8]
MEQQNLHYILTCEHAGNQVPAAYQELFEGHEEVLYSHQGMDFGALRLAKRLASDTELPLYYTLTTRLLVEPNRSLDNDDLFSDYSKKLPEKEKQQVLVHYYQPHRDQVEKYAQELISEGKNVLHLAVHTFTPVKDGEVRNVDIGILFDPNQPLEVAFARAFKQQLREINPERLVKDNEPYAGVDDGFPTYLRKQFSKTQYGGIELEVNQKFFLDGDPDVWENLQQEITRAFLAVVKR